MSKKKMIKHEEKEIQEPVQWIQGAFVISRRVIQSNLTEDVFLIKLSSINMVVPLSQEGKCLFYTYKDCCYIVNVSFSELRRAVDSFIFQPETHWESYGY